MFACETWNRDLVKKRLKEEVGIMKENGCIVEIIMKDISTLRYQPERLKEWAIIASEVAAEFS